MHWSSVLSTHVSHAHSLPPPLPPGSTTRWFILFYFYIFNLNCCRTMAATTSPSPSRTCRPPLSPKRPPPALVAGPMPPQLPLPGLPHPQQPQPDPHPPENI